MREVLRKTWGSRVALGVGALIAVGCRVPTDPMDADAGPADDTDLVVIRLQTDGTLDPSFGSDGIARIDLSTGEGNARDALWNAARDAQDRIVLFGGKRAEAPRADVDRVVVRLTPTGALDTGFADGGVYTLDIGNGADQARKGLVQADGKILSAGYYPQPTGVGTQVANRLALLRLNDDGTPDTSFGVGGVVTANPFVPADPVTTPWGFAEAYAVGVQNGGYVTAGYGRSGGSGTVDVVSFRFDAAGAPDEGWGSSGVYRLDVNGEHDRARNLVVLPDDRVVVVGSGTPLAGNLDAMVAVTTASGLPDDLWAPGGYELFDFERPEEVFFGAALSPTGDWVAAAGYRAGAVGGVEEDDDAILALLPFGSGATFAEATPVATEADDRFWNVTFDAAGKVVAVGFVVDQGDSCMVVARFNADGTPDSSFGTGGVVRVNVSVSGELETARGVAIQSDGKLVIAGVAEHL